LKRNWESKVGIKGEKGEAWEASPLFDLFFLCFLSLLLFVLSGIIGSATFETAINSTNDKINAKRVDVL
jgi:hypothetical protein